MASQQIFYLSQNEIDSAIRLNASSEKQGDTDENTTDDLSRSTVSAGIVVVGDDHTSIIKATLQVATVDVGQMGIAAVWRDDDDVTQPDPLELTAEDESHLLISLQDINLSLARLLGNMDSNLSLLEDSVCEVRTARQIAAESNLISRRRTLRDGNPELVGLPK